MEYVTRTSHLLNPTPMSQPRILLVEDEKTLLDAVKMNLEMEGYEVETAGSGTEAIKKFNEQRFNLVILDIMLPELDGYKVCQTIRVSNSELPILFLTAKDTSTDKVFGSNSALMIISPNHLTLKNFCCARKCS